MAKETKQEVSRVAASRQTMLKGNFSSANSTQEVVADYSSYRSDIAQAAGMDPDRILQQAASVIIATPALMECTKESLLGGIMQAAYLGLSLSKSLGECYLVPYPSNKKVGDQVFRVTEAQFQIGYQGWVKLAQRANLSIHAYTINSNDLFKPELGSEPKVIHVPNWEDPGTLRGAYASMKLPNGSNVVTILNMKDIEYLRTRNTSQLNPAKGTGAWGGEWNYRKMAIGKAIKQLKPYIPADPNMEAAFAADENVVHVSNFRNGQYHIGEIEARRNDTDPMALPPATDAEIFSPQPESTTK